MTPPIPAARRGLTRQSRAVEGRSDPLKVTGKLKVAVDYLAWNCDKTDLFAAAQYAGIATFTLRSALQKGHVKRYYDDQLRALYSSERANNFREARRLRDEGANEMARVAAIKHLEAVATDETWRFGPNQQRVAGLIIQINGAARGEPVKTILDSGPAQPPLSSDRSADDPPSEPPLDAA